MLVAIVLVSSWADALAAQPSSTESPSIPPTPAGEQLAWALEQVNAQGTGLTPLRIERHFAPIFLSGITPEQLISVFQLYVGPAGPMSVARFEGGVTDTRANALLSTPSGYWRVALSVDESEDHRINGLYFQPAWIPSEFAEPPDTWSGLKQQFQELAPRSGFYAAELTGNGCDPLARVNPEEPLAIASAFKLYVLGELARQVQAGDAQWDEPLAFDPSLVSLPNGDMRYAAPGELFPLVTWAEQMMAQSDNTATDHLIARLGRENVEASFMSMGHASPELNTPLLMTREWFAIKMRLSDRQIRRYELATSETRRQMLQTLVQPQAATLAEWEPWPAFRAIDSIEWFASPHDLCLAMASLLELSKQAGMEPVLNAMSLQPGITFDPEDWSYVGYKGGYEAGVKSDVWLLQRSDGRWFALVGVINDLSAEIDGYGMSDVMTAAASLLAIEP
ncbi:MAG: serine hydrolase [Thermomicrobiales bacterium]